jgi:hypothetical protein
MKFKNDEVTLNKLIEYSVDLYNCRFNDTSFKHIDYELENIISSAKYLKKKGYEFTITNAQIEFSNETDLKIYKDIENIITQIGGLEVAKIIFRMELTPHFNEKYKRYMVSRNKQTFNTSSVKRYFPYNYILQICVKQLTNENILENRVSQEKMSELYSEMKELSESYITCLNLQSHSSFEDIFIDYLDLPEVITKNILFDKLFIINQWNPNYVIEILEDVFREIYNEYRSWSYKLKDYIKVAQIILFEYKECSYIKFEDIFKKVSFKEVVLKDIFNDISQKEVNSEFTGILGKTNFSNKPLIQTGENEYFLLSPIICSFSFHEVLYNKFRKSTLGRELDNKLGNIVEDVVKRMLDKKKYSYKYGFYDFNCYKNLCMQNECDLILEDDKNVVFIEIKKRPLPKKSEEGDIIEVLRALGEGMVYAQRQALQHSLQLENKGEMILIESANKIESQKQMILEYKKRRVTRISLTYQEYGFLSYNTISKKIMESLLICEFHADDITKEKRLKKLKEQQGKLNRLVTEMNNSTGEKVDLNNLFFYSTFRSLQQFMYSLDHSDNISQLIENLTSDIFVDVGGLDFYKHLFNDIDRSEK